MIEEKYNIKHIQNIRCYKIDLTERNYFLEFSSPHLLIIDGKNIFENSWTGLMGRLFNYLTNKYNLSVEQLISFEVDWSRKPIFSLEEKTSFDCGPLENGVYYNVNQNSTHLQWIIQDFLNYMNETLESISLYIKIPANKEKPEVISHYMHLNKKKLKNFLCKRLGYDEKKVEKYFRLFLKIDKVFNKYFENQQSLLLLDTKGTYALYKSRFINKIKEEKKLDEFIKKIQYILDQLTLFYAYQEENLVLEN